MNGIFSTFHHVGLVVPNIGVYVGQWERALGCTATAVIEQPEIEARVCLLSPERGSSIELVEPMSSNSAVASFLERNRFGGLHHMCWAVSNLDVASNDLRAAGWMPTMKPFAALLFDGAMAAFFLSPERALVELVELGP